MESQIKTLADAIVAQCNIDAGQRAARQRGLYEVGLSTHYDPVEVKNWCASALSGKLYEVHGNYWFFESMEDLQLFLLKWDGKFYAAG